MQSFHPRLVLAALLVLAAPAAAQLGTGEETAGTLAPGAVPLEVMAQPVARFPRTHGTLEQGEGAYGVRELVERLRVRPGEMILMGDVGGHVIRPDGRGGIEVPTHEGSRSELPAAVREGRVIVYDHHHAAGQKVSGPGGYANAAHMILDHADRIAAHVQQQIESGSVRTLRFVSHSPPDLDSLTSHLVLEEVVDRVRFRRQFSRLIPDLAKVHAANADKGILGRPTDVASQTLEGVIEGLNREVTTEAEQVREGKRFLRRVMSLAERSPWFDPRKPSIPENRIPELIERLKGQDPMIRRAVARTDAIVREILELKTRAEGSRGEVVRGGGELAQAMTVRETFVQNAEGGIQRVRMATVEVNFINPISKLVFHTLYQNGVDVVLIKSNNAKGINYFACINGNKTKANLKGLMDPITQRLGLFDGSGYGNQINIGRVGDDVRVHDLGAEAARHGEVLERLHSQARELGVRPGERVRVSLEAAGGEASGTSYKVEAVSEGGAAREVGSLRVDAEGAITARPKAAPEGGAGRGGAPSGEAAAAAAAPGASEGAPRETRMQVFHRRFAARMQQAGVRLGEGTRSFFRGGSRSPAAMQATMIATMYLFAVVQVSQAEPGLSADETLAKAAEAAFSEEAIASLAAFMGVHLAAQGAGRGVEALAPVLQRIGVETGREVFRIGGYVATREGLLRAGGRALGTTGVVGGVTASHAVVGTYEADRLQDARIEGVGRGIDAAALHDPAQAARLKRVAQLYFEKSTVRLLLDAMDPDRLDYTLVLLEGFGWILGQVGGTVASGNPVVGFVAGASAATGVALLYENIRERLFEESDAIEDAEEVVADLRDEAAGESDGTPEGNARVVARLMQACAAGYDTLFGRVMAGHSQANRGFQVLAERLRALAVVGLGKQRYYRERDRLLVRALGRMRDANGGRASFRQMRPAFDAFNQMGPEFRMQAYPGRTTYEIQAQRSLSRSGDVSYMGDSGVYRDDFESFVPERSYVEDSGRVQLVVRRALASVRLTLRGFGLQASGGRPPLGETIRSTSLGPPLRKMWVGSTRGRAAVEGLEALAETEQERVTALMEGSSQAGFPDGFATVVSIQRAITAEKVGMHRLIQDGLDANLPELPIAVDSVLADGVAQWELALLPLRELAGEGYDPDQDTADAPPPAVVGGDGIYGVSGIGLPDSPPAP